MPVNEPATDIRIRRVTAHYPFVRARTPLKFGNVVVDALDFCHVNVEVENRRGRVAEGWGAMLLMDNWAWPTAAVPHDQRAVAMRELNRRLCLLFEAYDDFGHPIDIFLRVEGMMQDAAQAVCRERALAEEMPFLGTLVCASPIDLALHDAFGHVNGIDSWTGYISDFMANDLSVHLGDDFRGAWIGDFVHPMPPRIEAFHLVGGLDKLRAAEITPDDPHDGLPISLDQWIRHEHLHCLKVKLKGTDLAWDLWRLHEVARIAREEHEALGLSGLWFSADTNEQAESPDYCIELLRRLRELDPPAYDALLYLEQPTSRDLHGTRFDMRALARLKPVLIDESLTTLADLQLAMETGWSGLALKACKSISASLVFAAKAQRMGVPYTVQDLTNPGIALLASVGLAAHLNPLMGVEANSRQFFPQANEPEARVHPGVFHLHDGRIDTSSMTGAGLGVRWDEIGRTFSF